MVDFWIQFWFVGLFNCRKKAVFLFLLCFFLSGHAHSCFFPSYHHPRTSEDTVRLGNNQIPKANLFKKWKSIFHSYSKMHNNWESVYWEVSLSQPLVPSLFLPSRLVRTVQFMYTLGAHTGTVTHSELQDTLLAPCLRQLFYIPSGQWHSWYCPLN